MKPQRISKMVDVSDSNLHEKVDESKIDEDGKIEKEQIYTSIPQSDKMWVETVAKRIGGTKSEALRRIVKQARMYESVRDDIRFD